MSGFTLAALFAGAGGLTLGFTARGFAPTFAIEKDPTFAATYALNFGGHVETDEVAKFLARGVPMRRVDVLVGGPPCQGFSNLTGNHPSDPRRTLWRDYLAALKHFDPDIFLLENVPNFLAAAERGSFIAAAGALGYCIDRGAAAVLNAADYGIPQSRRRAFILGSRIGIMRLPEPTFHRRTIRDAFHGGVRPGDLRIPPKPFGLELKGSPTAGPDLHLGRSPTERSLARYRAIPTGGNRFDLARAGPDLLPDCWRRKRSGSTDVFGRLWWDRPSVTIRTEFFKPEKGRFLHPVEDRALTHWEALRLQTFPDDLLWCGSKVSVAAQIGNAVPPLWAEAFAREIEAALLRRRRQDRAISQRRRSAA